MHQVAHRSKSEAAYDMSTKRLTSTVLITSNTLDAELISALLLRDEYVELVSATADPDFALTRCQRLRPEILIVDPKIADDMLARSVELLHANAVQHLLVFDDCLHGARVNSLLSIPRVSYMTRLVGMKALQDGIQRIARTGERVFDPELEACLEIAGRGLRFKDSKNPSLVSGLTSRELEVMAMLARGSSVRQCAKQLELAESTVDNHKSRLMKKLDIHKIVELTHVAIKEGLIVV